MSCQNFFGKRHKKTGKQPVIIHYLHTKRYRTSKSQGFIPVCFLKAVLKCEILE